jgi:hypothetical protein
MGSPSPGPPARLCRTGRPQYERYPAIFLRQEINLDRLWATLVDDLPELVANLKDALQDITGIQ